jgi:hypothetical protein
MISQKAYITGRDVDQVNRILSAKAVAASPRRFPIDYDHFTAWHREMLLDSLDEPWLGLCRIPQPKHTTNRTFFSAILSPRSF